MDKYIYGHPFHRAFRSIEQFLPHFNYLVLHKEGKVCPCEFCQKRDKRGGRKAPAAKARGDRRRAPVSKGPKVGESSPAASPSLSTLLGELGNFDLSIEDRQSLVCVINKGVNEQIPNSLVGLAWRERDRSRGATSRVQAAFFCSSCGRTGPVV